MIQTVLAQVNITPDGIPEVVKLSQYENGRELRFEIVGNGMNILDTDTVTISGTKPDKTVYSAEGTLDNGVAVFDEDIQMTAALGMWDAKIKIIRGSETVATGRITFVIDSDTTNEDDIPSSSVIDGYIAEARLYAEEARSAAYGSPLVANTAADMDDETRVYVYTGDETGYTAGNWYYYDGEEWTSGGVYNSSAVQTDPSLSIPGMAADAAAVGEQLFSSETTQNNTPYLFRPIPVPATREKLDKVVGGTVAWNQLLSLSAKSEVVNGITFTVNNDGTINASGTAANAAPCFIVNVALTEGHVYFLDGCPQGGATKFALYANATNPQLFDVGEGSIKKQSANTTGKIYVIVYSGITVDITFIPQLFDFTLLFGSTIADYIYSLEQSTAGAGVAYFRKLFPEDYYEYDAGTLKSVEGMSAHVTKDADEEILGSYPLDSSLTLRGMLKKDASNNLYFDGDEYAPDGTVTRKYGVVDLGTLNWEYVSASDYMRATANLSDCMSVLSGAVNAVLGADYTIVDANALGTATGKAYTIYGAKPYFKGTGYTDAASFKTAMSGVYLVYELATPTTETADPYQQTQICDPDGTETFVTTGIVPVGHITEYPHDLKGKIEQLYGIPKPPTANGTYALKVTVSDSTITYSWV